MTSLAIKPVASKEAPIYDLFFPRHKNEVMKEMDPFLTKDTAGIVVSYLLSKENPFGPQEWKRYFGVEIVDPPQLRRNFYTWWFAPDPVDPSKQRCETHLPPILRPVSMSLEKLGALVQNPKEGPRSKYFIETRSLQRNKSLEAGPACYLVMRKDVLHRGCLDFDKHIKFIKNLNVSSHAGYEEKPSAMDLATVVFARHVCSGERHLGVETYSLVKETDSRNLVIGNFTEGGLLVGVISLTIGDINPFGIAAVKKF